MSVILDQDDFDQTIGRLDHALSKLIIYAEQTSCPVNSLGFISQSNRQTLKHHAEDMIGAGKKILDLIELLNKGVVR